MARSAAHVMAFDKTHLEIRRRDHGIDAGAYHRQPGQVGGAADIVKFDGKPLAGKRILPARVGGVFGSDIFDRQPIAVLCEDSTGAAMLDDAIPDRQPVPVDAFDFAGDLLVFDHRIVAADGDRPQGVSAAGGSTGGSIGGSIGGSTLPPASSALTRPSSAAIALAISWPRVFAALPPLLNPLDSSSAAPVILLVSVVYRNPALAIMSI